MSSVRTDAEAPLLVVPDSLQEQLRAFRTRIWFTKITEAILLSVVVVLMAFLTVYLTDRFIDTSATIRVALFILALLVWAVVPLAIHRWVWMQRRFEQLARLLRVREPAVGDQLLSVIELSKNESEQARSRTLCAAAIQQVADVAKTRDFSNAAPPAHLKRLGILLAIGLLAVVGLGVVFPDAIANAWSRFASPWSNTPRYTFTQLESLPSHVVVPHGESTRFDVQLSDTSRWQPESAQLDIPGFPPIVARLESGEYQFQLPPQVAAAESMLTVGDFYQPIQFEAKLRPELTGAIANIELPEYLQRKQMLEQDVRSGNMVAVKGSQARIHATASRDLAAATINGQAVEVAEASFTSPFVRLDEESRLQMEWRDHDGLEGREPFNLAVKPVEDELPSVVAQDFPQQSVVMESEQINFKALAADDFGVRRIGMSWQSLDDRLMEPTVGEKVISAGGPENTSMQVPATFNAKALGIEPQPIEVRLWVEDYMPERVRSYSVPYVVFILTSEQHAIWITDQLSKWHRASLDVRDAELQLHATNKRLRTLAAEGGEPLDRDGIKRQASLEAANGRRLSSLASTGEGLLRQAARNPELGVDQLEQWAQMLQILNDIGHNRMPSVAELLEQASSQPSPNAMANANAANPRNAKNANEKQGPRAGINRSGNQAMPQSEGPEDEGKKEDSPQLPTIADMESSLQPPEEREANSGNKKQNQSAGKLTLPSTTLVGPPPKNKDEEPEEEEQNAEQEDALEEALFEQEELLDEFQKISEELNALLANLEGSTLVKRLKAASREQDQIAQRISSRIANVFGVARAPSEDRLVLQELGAIEKASSQTVSYIMDDIQSFYERRRMDPFKLVLDEMKEVEVLMALEDLAEELQVQQGMSIAQAEFWSDTLDRWAEDLVESPTSDGKSEKGSQSADALPPRLILAMLKVLEQEVNLREETRVAEQARLAVEPEVHRKTAEGLATNQEGIRQQIDEVIMSIQQLPQGGQRFGAELDLLNNVSLIMIGATELLLAEETGSPTIGIETEAIELLLQSKRINPKGGGGGGMSPGGGGKGDTQDAALALLGSGLNQNEQREAREVGQATGEKGRVLPEEFRAGLDEYFRRIEEGQEGL